MRKLWVVLLLVAPVAAAGLLLWLSGASGPLDPSLPPGLLPESHNGPSPNSIGGPIPFLDAPQPGRSKTAPDAPLAPSPAGEGQPLTLQDLAQAPWVEGWASGSDLEVGYPAPDFVLPQPGGGWVQLSQWRGEKAVIVNFWATWCPPCREEMPDLEALRQRRGHEVEIIAVNLYESAEQVEPFVDSLGLTFPIALDRQGEVTRRYLVRPLPTSFFIDRDGIIRARYFGIMSASVMEGLLDLTLAGGELGS